jgi:Enolase C-terminal domain-like
VSVAPHNFYSHLATLMSAHFAAVVPNLRIMEIDPETVPWQDELVTVEPRINDGHLPQAATRSSSPRIARPASVVSTSVSRAAPWRTGRGQERAPILSRGREKLEPVGNEQW